MVEGGIDMPHRNQWNDIIYERIETAVALICFCHAKSNIKWIPLRWKQLRLFLADCNISLYFFLDFVVFISLCIMFSSIWIHGLTTQVRGYTQTHDDDDDDDTYTSSIRSPFLMPAFSAAPLSKQADTCCSGAYNCPLIERNWPPSDIWPRTLKPKPVSVL